ncbi:MAG: rod shape-determining protein MreC [Elusimicrobia bacterium]|nr:rod shape-determining protein MreC [Elusimicrobiota bacterium]MDE2236883.1 rod shape-determining protein MreC [Elusimicrobiota bacterium]MDE2425340.1 rod shape-determining protein MreC [Elusimicrobiota bacterium]
MHRETRAANYVLASFTIVSLTLLSFPLAGPVRAFEAFAGYVLDPVAYYGAQGVTRFGGIPGRLRDLISADIENHRMEDQVKGFQWIKQEAESLRIENARLRAELGLKAPRSKRDVLWASVMERDPMRWYRDIRVQAGSNSGVTLNSPVLGRLGGHLVVLGRITEVRPKTSVVLLVSDELSSVAAYVACASSGTAAGQPPRGVEGLLQGEGGARLRLNYLSPDAEVRLGDLVYTSPTSTTFPPNILLGEVSRIFPRDPFLTSRSVEVRPALEASRVKEVMILKQSAATAAKLEATARAAMGEGGEEDSEGAEARP